MKKLLLLLGFLWLLPATILVWLFYVLPVWALGYVQLVSWQFPIAKFRLSVRDNWYARLWKKWWGWSGPCVYVAKDAEYIKQDLYPQRVKQDWLEGAVKRTELHEVRHCFQGLVFGPLHYPLYLLMSILIWLYAAPFNKDLHAYLDNPFETDARKAAGQQVHIPRSQWPQGPNDRLPWW